MGSLGLAADELEGLILSVGTHRSQRRLSPYEVARLIDKALSAGTTRRQISDRLRLDPSMLGRFLRLLDLPGDIRELVDWGSGGGRLGMSGVSVIARIRGAANQREVARATLEHRLNASEITQVAQTRERSGRPISECIESALRLRPIVERRFLFIGAVTSADVTDALSRRTQSERDLILNTAIEGRAPDGETWDARLSPSRFSLLGPESFSRWVSTIPNDFETEVNAWLSECLGV